MRKRDVLMTFVKMEAKIFSAAPTYYKNLAKGVVVSAVMLSRESMGAAKQLYKTSGEAVDSALEEIGEVPGYTIFDTAVEYLDDSIDELKQFVNDFSNCQ